MHEHLIKYAFKYALKMLNYARKKMYKESSIHIFKSYIFSSATYY
jgi:hypothetical protein